MKYDIKNIQNKFNDLTERTTRKTSYGAFQEWKPRLTTDGKPKTWNVRMMPYADKDDQPVEEVVFYKSKSLDAFPLVAPMQYGLPDPVAEMRARLSEKSTKAKNLWPQIKELSGQSSFLLPIFVREEPEKGVQVWVMSSTACKDLYAILTSQDYESEVLNDPDKGFDLEVMVSPSGKTFTPPGTKVSYPVNDVKIKGRMKSTLLSKNPTEAKTLLESVPNLRQIHRDKVKSYEFLANLVDNFINRSVPGVEEQRNRQEEEVDTDKAALKNVEAQFDEIEF